MVKTIRIAVCDDNLILASQIEQHLLEIKVQYNIDMHIDVLSDGTELSNMIQQGIHYDIVYLDIEMKSMNGLEAAKSLRDVDLTTILIFVSSHHGYVYEIFDTKPLYFMRKPIQWDEFDKWFKKAYVEIEKKDVYFEFTVNRVPHKVFIQDILYFESNVRVISIVCKDKSYDFYGRMNMIEKEMTNSDIEFIRVHQSYLVNVQHIRGFSFNKVELPNGTEIPVSEERRKRAREEYSKHMWRRME